MLLNSKSAIREQIAGDIILNPAERRASLVHTNEMIDDVIALKGELSALQLRSFVRSGTTRD